MRSRSPTPRTPPFFHENLDSRARRAPQNWRLVRTTTTPNRMKPITFYILCLTAPTLGWAAPAATADTSKLDEVVVTATRLEMNIFNVPAAISRVSATQLRE